MILLMLIYALTLGLNILTIGQIYTQNQIPLTVLLRNGNKIHKDNTVLIKLSILRKMDSV
jgi:hypothetical protein